MNVEYLLHLKVSRNGKIWLFPVWTAGKIDVVQLSETARYGCEPFFLSKKFLDALRRDFQIFASKLGEKPEAEWWNMENSIFSLLK